MYLHHSQTMDMAATTILFIKFLELQFNLDLVIDSVYITDTYHFRLYFFFRRDFVVPLSHPLFDPAAPFIAIPLHMAHPVALAATPPQAAPASPPQVVPSLSFESDPSEEVASSSLSSAPGDDYVPAYPSMVNGFLSSESI